MSAALPRHVRAAVVPGLAAAAGIALCARFASEWLGAALFDLGKSPVSPIMIAVLAGVAIRSTVGATPRLEAGIAMATRLLLRTGLALIGLRLTLAGLGTLGVRALPVVAGCLAAGWLLIPRIARAFGLRGSLVTLLTVGTTICGCTAIMAVAPVIRARAEETGYAVTVIVIVGLAGMLAYPALAHDLFGATPAAAGIFLGAAIHDTSQVMGAALLYSGQYRCCSWYRCSRPCMPGRREAQRAAGSRRSEASCRASSSPSWRSRRCARSATRPGASAARCGPRHWLRQGRYRRSC
jgi:uncharacterized integral membrane protein (TIGR00698 family)